MNDIYQYRGLVNSSRENAKRVERQFEKENGPIKEFLQKEYVDKMKSLKCIGEETGHSPTYIKSLLLRNGFRIRGQGEANIGRKHHMSQSAKDYLKRVFNRPEVKEKRSMSQKLVWSKLSYEERIKRTTPGNTVRTKNAMKTQISSIELKVAGQLDCLGIRYIQQKELCGGKFYVDFYIPEFRIVIECNGDYWHRLPNRIQRDKELEEYVKQSGREVIFIWEHEINDEWFWVGDYIERMWL